MSLTIESPFRGWIINYISEHKTTFSQSSLESLGLEEFIEDDFLDGAEDIPDQLGVCGCRLEAVNVSRLVLVLAQIAAFNEAPENISATVVRLFLFLHCLLVLVGALVVRTVVHQLDTSQLLLEQINLVKEHNEGSALEEDTVENLLEEMEALGHPVGGVVLVQHKVELAQGDDEKH